jgi:hypothetical protein
MLGNGCVSLNEALLNFSVATTLWFPHVNHFDVPHEVNQVATL